MRFGLFFPDLAARERRSIILEEPAFQFGRLVLPDDEYAFEELYCVETGCDCRRVMMNVLSRNMRKHIATINHAFEPPTRDDEVPEQTFLDPINVQSEWSVALLDIFKNLVLSDRAYRKRLVRHYRLVKDAVADPAHPCQQLLRKAELEEEKGIVEAMRRSPIPPPPRRGKRKWR